MNNMDFCLDTSAMWQFAGYILLILKVLVPVIIIVLGIVDLAKAVMSSDDKAVNKATTAIISRLIIGVAIFFIPTIISFIFSIVKDAAPAVSAAEECQVCLLRPTSGECENFKETAKQNREDRNNRLS